MLRWYTQVSCLALVGLSLPTAAPGQPVGRRVTTLESINLAPIFFHGEEVVVHAEAAADGVLVYLVNGDERLLTLDVPPPPTGMRERLEVVGTYYDIGRLQPENARTADLPFGRLASSLLGKPWPGVGELPIIVASSSRVVPDASGATLRGLALNPGDYLDETVTVTGRFRGRNLYGDLPDSPRRSRWDFVLASADAAVWISGMEPRGDGFDLDIQARIDTGRWLEVSGTASLFEGMAVVDASTIELADPPETARPPTPRRTRRGPPPEVIFSAPLPDETEVPNDTTVRIQFSRDMDPDSFDGQVSVVYTTPGGDAVTTPGDVAFQVAYRPRNRVLEIVFDEELERFRTLAVTLRNGIAATDGMALAPWTLSFFVGG